MKVETVRMPSINGTLNGHWELQPTKGEIWVYRPVNPSPHNKWYFEISKGQENEYFVYVRFEFETEPDCRLLRDDYMLALPTKTNALEFAESLIKKAGVS